MAEELGQHTRMDWSNAAPLTNMTHERAAGPLGVGLGWKAMPGGCGHGEAFGHVAHVNVLEMEAVRRLLMRSLNEGVHGKSMLVYVDPRVFLCAIATGRSSSYR